MDVGFIGLGNLGEKLANSLLRNGINLSVIDLDNDGDLEIFGGTTGDLIVLDIKETSHSSSYWNIYRGNFKRNGLYLMENQCSFGDLNEDGIINILDIVRLVNIVVDPSTATDAEICAADLNSDNVTNILDIVTLVNLILDTI